MAKQSIYEQRPWLKSYAPGMPADLDKLEHQSVAQLLERACEIHSELPAFTCMGKTLSYNQLLRQSSSIAAWLVSKGLQKGDRIAIMMPNILQYPAIMLAVLRAGLTVVNVNPLYTPRELRHQLVDSGARAIFVLENFAATVSEVFADTALEHAVVTSLGEQLGGLKGGLVNFVVRKLKKMVPAWDLPDHITFKQVLATDGAGFKLVSSDHKDLAFLQYTGGTTGLSKGAMLTNANVLANVAQNKLWLSVLDEDKDDIAGSLYVCALPLYHIFALTVNALMGMERGAHNLLIPNPRDLPTFVKTLKGQKFEMFPGLNTLFNGLLNNEAFRQLDFSHLKLTVGGGMAVQRPVAERWEAVTGSVIAEGYGLSETSPVATANRFDATEFTGTIGLPLPSTYIAIRDEDGVDLSLGEVGEICIKGPQVMAGYWQRKDATAEVMTKDGYFRSGDMGFMNEDGFTKIVDRKKDMILVSGFNVYPNEVEEFAVTHDKIVEAAAIGVPDENSGETVKLFVVRADDSIDEEAVKAWCATGLTNYKRPKYVEFRDELPKTNVGKILRRQLRD